jgi:hypothetical protein
LPIRRPDRLEVITGSRRQIEPLIAVVEQVDITVIDSITAQEKLPCRRPTQTAFLTQPDHRLNTRLVNDFKPGLLKSKA